LLIITGVISQVKLMTADGNEEADLMSLYTFVSILAHVVLPEKDNSLNVKQ